VSPAKGTKMAVFSLLCLFMPWYGWVLLLALILAVLIFD
jgi:hypothetical protein